MAVYAIAGDRKKCWATGSTCPISISVELNRVCLLVCFGPWVLKEVWNKLEFQRAIGFFQDFPLDNRALRKFFSA